MSRQRLACPCVPPSHIACCITAPGVPPLPALQALLLAGLAVVLPLPLRHHMWAQLLVLRTVYWRVAAAARLHASQPGGPGQCQAFVATARNGVAVLVPGSVPDALHDPPAAQACWMFHVWSATMLGYLLPAALIAGLEQHAAWRQACGARRRPRGGAQPSSRLSTPEAGSPTGGTPQQRRSPSLSPAPSTSGSSSSSSSTSTSCTSLERLPAAVAAASRLSRTLAPHLRAGHALSCDLAQCLLLLLPLGASLFAALEVATDLM